MTNHKSQFELKKLPVDYDFYKNPELITATIEANRYLSELKGIAKTIPNENILINTLILQEAKDSSEIENIITTHDELYRSIVDDTDVSPQTKEVRQYRQAIMEGYRLIKQKKILTLQDILTIHQILVRNTSGIRKLPGTKLINDRTGEVVYTPPQNYEVIKDYLDNLIAYINDDSLQKLDYTIKMAIIHYQFESIHPFYDGNGRTGRIINVLYLIQKGLLDTPILYLSRYIIRNKNRYYQLLREVGQKNNWDSWVLFILNGLKEISIETINKIGDINRIMQEVKMKIRSEANKIYSKDLLEHLFYHPYTKINHLAQSLKIHRQTATKYLNTLVEIGIMDKIRFGREYFYVNKRLYELLSK